MARVGFKKGHDLFFLPFNDLDDLERILEFLTRHGVVVIDTGTTSSEVGERTLAVVDGDRGADVQGVGVLDSTNQFVNADGFDLFRIFFAVCVCRSDGHFCFLVGFCVAQSGFKTWNEVSRANNAHHRGVLATFLDHLMFLCDFFTGCFDEVTVFAVVQFIINVDNCSFFHVLTSKGDESATSPPLIIALDRIILPRLAFRSRR